MRVDGLTGGLRDTCGSCGTSPLHPVLDLGSTPAANLLPADPAEQQPRYPLGLAVCERCWLVQQTGIVPDRDLYGPGYAFYSAASLPKQQYHRDLARRLLTDHGDLARRFTVEVACNDGDLLRHFRDVGCPTLGVDPAVGPAAQATDRGLTVCHEPFTTALAGQVVDHRGQAGLLIANHVAAHVSDLDDFFGGVDVLLAVDGVAVVEVQYLLDLLVGNQIDHVYHEHRYHFSVSSLAAVTGRHHLFPAAVRRTPAQSGSISVTLTRDPTPRGVAQVLDGERWLRSPAAYHGLQDRAHHIRTVLGNLLADEADAGRTVAGYACPAKAATLLNWCGIGPETVPYVVDTTPYKQGRYIPGTGIPIVGRAWDGAAANLYTRTVPAGRDLPDTWLLLAWNYLADVLRREHEFTADGGRWLVPIPVPVIL